MTSDEDERVAALIEQAFTLSPPALERLVRTLAPALTYMRNDEKTRRKHWLVGLYVRRFGGGISLRADTAQLERRLAAYAATQWNTDQHLAIFPAGRENERAVLWELMVLGGLPSADHFRKWLPVSTKKAYGRARRTGR